MDIGHRMKELRVHYGLTQQELADRSGAVQGIYLSVRTKSDFSFCWNAS